MPLLPSRNCLAAAVATPMTSDLRPDSKRMIEFVHYLFSQGVDGITIFGTTGEGPEFSVSDRMATLDALISAGIEPQRIMVSIGALAFEDSVTLLRHATGQGVYGCLLMTPCMYRGGITDDGVFEFYRQIIERGGRDDLRLFVYNFPDISGVTISLRMLRRLAEKYPRNIIGVKDSGGDPDLTRQYILSFSEMSIFTGNEIDLPELNPLGLTGTVCGLANIMPTFMRTLTDTANSYEGRPLVEALRAADAILSRYPFIPSAKAIIADTMSDRNWLRLMPPMVQPPAPQSAQMVDAYRRWEQGAAELLPAAPEIAVHSNVTPIRIA
ncbi:dihydrodipicolinate synthase family protein [Hoeflea sp. G2-23]|uniref:Dihydrodipicolinate synthase family protein n=1 Tax=Hoeflea algicola TaxID=2983763 RepID=A0ABT3ZEJ8_9HYPH|nr:dihydrodipicolinate synthase family protein [Hoeflea algicola]MCY0150061.1 dihydrodipicolinate synthase family protein [Hoeflea algicola]